MILDPKSWRIAEGRTLMAVATLCGIVGRNPARTYGRYEDGSAPCPAIVIETVLALSEGAVGPEAWHQVRIGFLERRRTPAATNGSS